MESEIPMTVEVEAFCNVHEHFREGGEEGDKVRGPLIAELIKGGADVVLPIPNTKAGLTTAVQVLEYIAGAKKLVPEGEVLDFIPAMLVNEQTLVDEIDRAADAGIQDIKILPLNRTTQSHNGVRHYSKLLPALKRCGKLKVKKHFHPEHPWMKFMSRDAEFLFLPILDMFLNETEGILVSEHGTDGRCIPFWKEMAESGRFFVTLTAHHLATNEDKAFGDVRSVCKPPIKTEDDRTSLLALIAEDNSWVMAGPDGAPHDIHSKHVHEDQCACGAYVPFALQLYAHVLQDLFKTPAGLQTFVNFTSRNARKFHKLRVASRMRTLLRQDFEIPLSYKIGSWTVEPFWAGRKISYSLVP